jgi:TonB-dependent starch-binding outer membrane protein SusC
MKLKFNFKSFLLLVSFLTFGNLLLAQRSIKGVISDAQTKETLIGANVKVVGTTKGAVSDLDGNYAIEIPAGATQLEFSYTGYATQIVTVGASNIVDIAMKQGRALEELVVVGYGTQKRKDLTGSITSITSENFVKGAVQTPEQLIAGKVAGVQITSNSGQPGAGSTIRIRGGSSLNASNDPLIVVDGVPLDNGTINGAANPLGFVNPADIESMTILKDASATAIYGARAANGVIMIVTKKGAAGKIKVNFNTLVSVGQLTKYADVFNAAEFKSLVNAKGTPAQIKSLGTDDTNWQEAIYTNPLSADNNLAVSGSLGAIPYRASLNYLNQKGLLKNSDMNRLGASIGLSPTFLNKSLKVNVNYKVSQLKNNFADQGAIGSSIVFDPTRPIYDATNTRMSGYFESRKDTILNSLAPKNPLALLDLKKDQSNVLRQIGNVQLDYIIPFVSGLRANLNVGFDAANAQGDKSTPAASAAGLAVKGTQGEYFQNKLNKLMEVYLNYNKEIGISKFDITAGHAYQSFYNETRGFDREFSQLKAVDQRPDTSKYVLASFFGRANYTLKDRYILTVTMRADATSKFSPENRWGYFPSAAIAWKLKEENFLKNSKLFSDLKIRVGYGIVGQQEGIGNYASQAIYTPGQSTVSYNLGEGLIQTYRAEAYDRNLKWEETSNINLALDYGFFNGKVFGSIDFYNRNTTDLISEISVPAGSNLKNKVVTNVGSMNNKGVEFILNLNAINTDKSNLTFAFNATRNFNEITSLSKTPDPKAIGLETGGISGIGQNIQVHSIGYSRNAFFVYQQVYNTDGKPIEGLYADKNGDGKINQEDRYRYKSSVPDWLLGFSPQYAYKNFNASCTVRSNIGNYVYNNLFSNLGNYNAINAGEGAVNNISTNVAETGFVTPQLRSDYYIENASFLRMDNVSFGYNFSNVLKSKLNLNVSFNIQNVFVFSKYKGLDPEVFSGIDNNIYPRARTYALGLNLGF